MKSNIHALRQRKVELVKSQRAMLDAAHAEGRDLNEADAAKYEENTNALAKLEASIEREERLLELERGMRTVVDDNQAASAAAGAPAAAKNQGFANFGEFLQAVVRAERTNGRSLDSRLMHAAASGASEGVPADGGFMVQKDYAQDILTRAFDGGEILSRVRKNNVSGNGLKMNAVDETSRATGSRWGGVQAYWANEADTVTSKRPKFRQMELTLNKLFALYYATDELLEDTAAFSDIAVRAFSEELTFMAEDAIFEGNGSGQPLGILNAGCLVTVNKETSQVADTVVSENVLKMYARMPARSTKNAIWLTNIEVLSQLPQLNIKIKNVAGSENVGGISTPIYQFPNGNGYGTILGRPVVPVEYASAIGDLGDLVLADLDQYQLIQKASGIQTASSMHVRFLNDEMVFRLTFRLDGQPIWNSALTPFKGASTLSPFVTLQAR